MRSDCAERRALRDLEATLTVSDPVLAAELRDGCPRPVSPAPTRLAVALLAGCTATGLVSAIAALLTVWWWLPHRDRL